MVRPMVHSTKHIVQKSVATILAGAKLDIIIASAVDVAAKTGLNQTEEGNSIKACFNEYWLRSSEVSPGSFVAALYKVPGTGIKFTTANMAALGGVENKKNILWTGQGLLNDQDADALAIMRGWYKIPKSKQRFGLGDELVLTIFAQGAIDILVCGFSTYKEYS